jgi:hypothetical protein
MMLQYDEAVQVHRAPVDGTGAPDQFLWRGRLWRVCAVRKHWVESAAWWQSENGDPGWGPDRTVYRVDAGSGRHGRQETFDLAFDPASERWQLERVTER